jgi:hypothetical protein
MALPVLGSSSSVYVFSLLHPLGVTKEFSLLSEQRSQVPAVSLVAMLLAWVVLFVCCALQSIGQQVLDVLPRTQLPLLQSHSVQQLC